MSAAVEPPTYLLELQGIRASYDAIEVLHGIDLQVPAGTVVALLGPNGAGKTTTLNVACGLIAPRAGKVIIAGRDVTGVAPEELARRGVITIPEGRGIFPNLTVRENLQMATYSGRPLAEVEEMTYRQFPRLGERRSQLVGTMSGGEQQMLAMARGLASNPAILLLDELSMGLAPLVVEELYGIVADIAASGVSILWSSSSHERSSVSPIWPRSWCTVSFAPSAPRRKSKKSCPPRISVDSRRATLKETRTP